jgi:hypothetical protein
VTARAHRHRQVVPAEEAVMVEVTEGTKVYRQGRWWREGERLLVTSHDADRMVKRGTVRRWVA